MFGFKMAPNPIAIAALALSAWYSTVVAAKQSVQPIASRDSLPPAEDKTQVRVRELVYILRYHRVWDRNSEWGAAIQELTKIGTPALPELLLELKQTERGVTMRGLLFTLRAINDPRALPFVIEALPKAERLSNGGSDCGLYFDDPELHRFMKQHQYYADNSDDDAMYGRPINEILGTLHKLSKTTPPRLSEGPEPTWHAKYWREWWDKNTKDGTAPSKDESLQLASRTEDLVERDGIRKFRSLFLTGAGQHLSPVAEVTLRNQWVADVLSAFDFETGRAYEYLEGARYEPNHELKGSHIRKWQIKNGIDLDSNEGRDLHIWQIDNRRWDSLDSEVNSNKRFDIGREVPSIWTLGNKLTSNQTKTYLFTTREGSRGVVRVHRKPDDDRLRFEYRLWNRDANAVQVLRTPPPGDKGEWQPQKIVMLKEPGFGKRCLFDLDNGKSEALPASIFAPGSPPDINELLNAKGPIFSDERIAAWARGQGLDLATHRSHVISEGGDRPPEKIGELILLDARMVQVTAEAFDNLTIARAKEILARQPGEFTLTYLYPQVHREGLPDTYLFETKSGLIGLIAILNVRDDVSSIGFQYKSAASAKKSAVEDQSQKR
jgi:hypothetical protein